MRDMQPSQGARLGSTVMVTPETQGCQVLLTGLSTAAEGEVGWLYGADSHAGLPCAVGPGPVGRSISS